MVSDNLYNKDIIEDLLNDEKQIDCDIPQRQRQILNAAIKLFSEKGFQGSRTSEIAKAANVAEGTIFKYYKTKKDLLVGLLIPIVVEFIRPIITLSAEKIIEDNGDQKVEEVMFNLMKDRLILLRKNFPLIKIVTIESLYNPELNEILRKEFYPKLIILIDGYVRKNIKNGNFREIDTSTIARSIVSSVIGYELLRNIVPDYFSADKDDEEIKKIVDVVLNGISNKYNH